MAKRKIFFSSVLCLTLLLLASCKKDDDCDDGFVIDPILELRLFVLNTEGENTIDIENGFNQENIQLIDSDTENTIDLFFENFDNGEGTFFYVGLFDIENNREYNLVLNENNILRVNFFYTDTQAECIGLVRNITSVTLNDEIVSSNDNYTYNLIIAVM